MNYQRIIRDPQQEHQDLTKAFIRWGYLHDRKEQKIGPGMDQI